MVKKFYVEKSVLKYMQCIYVRKMCFKLYNMILFTLTLNFAITAGCESHEGNV